MRHGIQTHSDGNGPWEQTSEEAHRFSGKEAHRFSSSEAAHRSLVRFRTNSNVLQFQATQTKWLKNKREELQGNVNICYPSIFMYRTLFIYFIQK